MRPRRKVELVESGTWALPRGGNGDMDGDHVPKSTAAAGRRPALYTAGMLPRTGDSDRYSDLLAGLSEKADLAGRALRPARHCDQISGWRQMRAVDARSLLRGYGYRAGEAEGDHATNPVGKVAAPGAPPGDMAGRTLTDALLVTPSFFMGLGRDRPYLPANCLSLRVSSRGFRLVEIVTAWAGLDFLFRGYLALRLAWRPRAETGARRCLPPPCARLVCWMVCPWMLADWWQRWLRAMVGGRRLSWAYAGASEGAAIVLRSRGVPFRQTNADLLMRVHPGRWVLDTWAPCLSSFTC